MIFAWKAPLDYPEKMLGSYGPEAGSYKSEKSNFNYLALSDGKPFPEDMDKPEIFFDSPENKIQENDCLWLLGGVPLVSARLAQFIQSQSPTSTQVIQPKSIRAAGLKTSIDYVILNITKTASVIDLEKSDAEKDDDGRIIYFNQTFLRPEYEFDEPLARESTSHDLLISKSLTDKITQDNFKAMNGWGFYTINRRYIPYLPS